MRQVMMKYSVGVALALCLLALLLPETTLAAEGNVIYVGEVELAKGEYTSDGMSKSSGALPSDGYARFYDSGGVSVLELNNFAYSGEGYSINTNDRVVIYYNGNGLLILELRGESSIVQSGGTPSYSYGLYASSDVTASGSGSLTAAGGIAGVNSYGVYAGVINVSGGSLTGVGGGAEANSYGVFVYEEDYIDYRISVSSGGNLRGMGGNAVGKTGASYGVYTQNGSVIVSGGSLRGEGGSASGEHSTSWGIYAIDEIVVADNGGLEGVGGEAAAHSYGVESIRITVSDTGRLEGKGGEDGDESIGVDARSSIFVDGGSLIGMGGKANSYSCGVESSDITVSDGSLTGQGGDTSNEYGASFGVASNITISGGSLTGKGGRASRASHGMEAYNALRFSGTNSTIHAEGAHAAIIVVRTDGSFTIEKPLHMLKPAGGKIGIGGSSNVTILDKENNTAKEAYILIMDDHAKGDANRDGRIGLDDAVLAARIAVGAAVYGPDTDEYAYAYFLADIDGDGAVKVNDVIAICNVLVGRA